MFLTSLSFILQFVIYLFYFAVFIFIQPCWVSVLVHSFIIFFCRQSPVFLFLKSQSLFNLFSGILFFSLSYILLPSVCSFHYYQPCRSNIFCSFFFLSFCIGNSQDYLNHICKGSFFLVKFSTIEVKSLRRYYLLVQGFSRLLPDLLSQKNRGLVMSSEIKIRKNCSIPRNMNNQGCTFTPQRHTLVS